MTRTCAGDAEATDDGANPARRGSSRHLLDVAYGFEAISAASSRRNDVIVPAAAWPRPCADRPEWRRQEHDDQHDHRRPHAELGPHRLSRPARSAALESHGICRRGHRPNVPEPAPVRGPVGARQRDAWAAQPHEERLLGLATGAAQLAGKEAAANAACNRNSRHRLVFASWRNVAGWEPSLRPAASRGAGTRAGDRTATAAARRAGGRPQSAGDG